MSNIKLKDHNWAAEGIYDTNQSKSQQTINSDVSTKIGQATLQTSSQNLSGATNELKGRADTLDSKYDNVVTVANTQPSSEYNKVWLPLTVSEGTQVPTWAEHQALESSLNGAINAITPLDTTPTANSTKGITSGAVKAVENKIAYKSRTLLWSNPTSAELQAGNITLSSGDYDLLEVWFTPTNDSATSMIVQFFQKTTRNIALQTYQLGSNNFYNTFLLTRYLVYVNSTTFNATNCFIMRFGNSNAQTTFAPYFDTATPTFAIPRYIYGIKV